jgi:uncharacterized membrane protein YfcA
VTILLATLLVGGFAGTVGALLGVGGGLFLVPFLNRVLGLPFAVATGVSLVTIIATSTASSAPRGRLQIVNLRLAMVLEVFTVAGALSAISLFASRTDEALRLPFAWTMVAIAAVVLSRLDRRNVIADPTIEVGWLGGRYREDEAGGVVSYRLKRTPVAFVMSFFAGVVSQFGIGGGVMVVPALNTWCGVPIRVAAATSSFMLGVTALVGATHSFVKGDVSPELAAAAVLGVLGGTQVGVRLGVRVPAKIQKILMICLLLTVWVIYFFDLKAHK